MGMWHLSCLLFVAPCFESACVGGFVFGFIVDCACDVGVVAVAVRQFCFIGATADVVGLSGVVGDKQHFGDVFKLVGKSKITCIAVWDGELFRTDIVVCGVVVGVA